MFNIDFCFLNNSKLGVLQKTTTEFSISFFKSFLVYSAISSNSMELVCINETERGKGIFKNI